MTPHRAYFSWKHCCQAVSVPPTAALHGTLSPVEGLTFPHSVGIVSPQGRYSELVAVYLVSFPSWLHAGFPHRVGIPGPLCSCSPVGTVPPSPSGDLGPSFGPAMKPSSDIESPVATFPMFVFLESFPIVFWAKDTAKGLETTR
jgi:hypothetical protein